MSDGKDLETFAAAGPGGEIVPYLSPKQRAALMDWVMLEVGGGAGMADWVKRSDENRTAFYRMWAKGSARPVVDPEGDKSKGQIEELLARLDAGESATVINATPVARRDDE